MFDFYFTFADGCGQSHLKIERAGENFNWSFRPNCDCLAESMVLSEFGVYDNLRNIFNLLHYNSSAYSHIEFFAPGFPRVYVNMWDIFSALPYIEYTMFSLIRNIKPEEEPVVQESEAVEDEAEDEEDEEEADEDDEADDEDEEAEDADDEDEEADEEADDEEADDEADNSDDQYADMPPLVSVDYCPCTPSRKTSRVCPQLPRRFVVNEIIDDGPCSNTRAAKSRRLNSSERVASHLFFD